MTEDKLAPSEKWKLSGYEAPDQSDWLTGQHPMDDLLRGERLPHIWCQGCGLGTVLTTFISALQWQEQTRWVKSGNRNGQACQRERRWFYCSARLSR